MSRELLKRAAFVLREVLDNDDCYCAPSVIKLQKEIVAYLAQPEPEPEPVAWMWTDGLEVYFENSGDPDHNWVPLYTAPPDQSARVAEPEPVGIVNVFIYEITQKCFDTEWLSYPQDWEFGTHKLYTTPPDQSAQIVELKAALQLAKDMMIANDLSLPRTFEVIDEALAKAKGEV